MVNNGSRTALKAKEQAGLSRDENDGNGDAECRDDKVRFLMKEVLEGDEEHIDDRVSV